MVEPKQNSQYLSAESSILGVSNDGTEDGYDDGERVKKSALTNERCTLASRSLRILPLSPLALELSGGGTITGTA